MMVALLYCPIDIANIRNPRADSHDYTHHTPQSVSTPTTPYEVVVLAQSEVILGTPQEDPYHITLDQVTN